MVGNYYSAPRNPCRVWVGGWVCRSHALARRRRPGAVAGAVASGPERVWAAARGAPYILFYIKTKLHLFFSLPEPKFVFYRTKRRAERGAALARCPRRAGAVGGCPTRAGALAGCPTRAGAVRGCGSTPAAGPSWGKRDAAARRPSPLPPCPPPPPRPAPHPHRGVPTGLHYPGFCPIRLDLVRSSQEAPRGCSHGSAL